MVNIVIILFSQAECNFLIWCRTRYTVCRLCDEWDEDSLVLAVLGSDSVWHKEYGIHAPASSELECMLCE